tara:strand:+ start:1080 stop:2549 length:1470 start_codon:yes stop_codon:yes gene_type:complete
MLIGIDTEMARRRKAPVGSVPGSEEFFPNESEGVNLGLMNEARRQKIRAGVESFPPTIQFMIEMAPQTVATYIGSRIGGLKGATLLGGGAEAISQDIGLSPRSDLGLGLSIGSPAGGHLAGKGLQSLKKAGAGLTKAVVPVRVAIARNAMRNAVDEFEAMGSKIIAKTRGFMGGKASNLYAIAERATVKLVPNFNASQTQGALKSIKAEMTKMKAMENSPQGKLVLGLIKDIEEILAKDTISFSDLIFIRKSLGPAIGKAERAAGTKLGAEKILFKGIAGDMDILAKAGGKTGAKGKIAQAAFARAKLDFAITDFNKGVARFITPIKGVNARQLDIKGMRKWLDNVTNIDHAAYKKNFTESLKDELPRIKERLLELDEFADASPAGPGGLVLRGLLAKLGFDIGGFAGKLAGVETVGQVVGSFAAIRVPEVLTGIVSSDAAVRFLKAAIVAGRGEINAKAWQTAGQIAAQGIKFGEQRAQAKLDQPLGP